MPSTTTPGTSDETRERIVDAALELAATRPWDEVRLADIAERAGIGLGDLRAAFEGKLDILAGFSARIDRQVLDGLDPDLAGEPPRERLFDVMMARFDALQPHREAVRSIARAFRRRPGDALAWNPVAVRSMTWMLEAAGVDTSGRAGALRAQGLAVAFARTLSVWLRDEDAGMARTMAALDQRLREGEGWLRRVDGLCSIAGALSRAGRRRRGRMGAAEAEGSGI